MSVTPTELHFITDIEIPWEKGMHGKTLKIAGVCLNEPMSVDGDPLDKTVIGFQQLPNTFHPYAVLLSERGGRRAILIPISLTFQVCVVSDINIVRS